MVATHFAHQHLIVPRSDADGHCVPQQGAHHSGCVRHVHLRGLCVHGLLHSTGLVKYSTLEAHDACVASGAMSQLLLWIGLVEVISLIGVDQIDAARIRPRGW